MKAAPPPSPSPSICTTTLFEGTDRVTVDPAINVASAQNHPPHPQKKEGAQDFTPLLTYKKADKELRSIVEEVGLFKQIGQNVPVKAQREQEIAQRKEAIADQ